MIDDTSLNHGFSDYTRIIFIVQNYSVIKIGVSGCRKNVIDIMFISDFGVAQRLQIYKTEHQNIEVFPLCTATVALVVILLASYHTVLVYIEYIATCCE